MNLIYVADPMCSWCYGFGKPLQALLDRQRDATLSIVMGGLRPYTTEPLAESKRDDILTHWRHVYEASGQAFAEPPATAMHAPDFVYDTEPACRAVITVREHWPQLTWPYLKAIQRTFYAEARNITQAGVLADVAESLGIERGTFENAFTSAAMQDATRRDFAQAQAWGIRGFPALIAGSGQTLTLIASGYTDEATLSARLDRLRAQDTQADSRP